MSQKLVKFLHTLGSVGFAGGVASLLALYAFLPPPTDVAGYAQMRAAMLGVADWVYLPSLLIVLVSGLLAVALRPAFIHSGWVVVKVAFSILLFEQGLIAVHGPLDAEARLSARVLDGAADPARLGGSIWREQASLWVMMALAALNIWLGVLRPRFARRRAEPVAAADESAG